MSKNFMAREVFELGSPFFKRGRNGTHVPTNRMIVALNCLADGGNFSETMKPIFTEALYESMRDDEVQQLYSYLNFLLSHFIWDEDAEWYYLDLELHSKDRELDLIDIVPLNDLAVWYYPNDWGTTPMATGELITN